MASTTRTAMPPVPPMACRRWCRRCSPICRRIGSPEPGHRLSCRPAITIRRQQPLECPTALGGNGWTLWICCSIAFRSLACASRPHCRSTRPDVPRRAARSGSWSATPVALPHHRRRCPPQAASCSPRPCVSGMPVPPRRRCRRARNMPLRAPMLVLVIASVKPHPKVPEGEQLLAAGCAAHGLLLAAHAQGIGRCGAPGSFPTIRGCSRASG